MTALRRFGLVLALGFLTASGALAQTTPSGIDDLEWETISSPQFEAEFPGMPNLFLPPGARRAGLIQNAPFLAEAHPRNGAILMGAYADWCNDHDSAIMSMSLTSTDIFGNNPQPIGATTLPPMAGCVSSYLDLSGMGYVADNRSKHLIARFQLGSGDPNNSFASIRLGWDKGGFSYPPAAFFNDVPDTHPFFKYIQKLREIGITGGCSMAPPLYCADGPVTRGQMAVFLVRAFYAN
jgi:hypothetical protein